MSDNGTGRRFFALVYTLNRKIKSLCTSVPNVDSNSAFHQNGENREVTVYVASGMRNEYIDYCPEYSWTEPWTTLENENRIKIVEKE